MTEDTSLGIGELARLTGVPVRTIRFYCDEGIVGSARSAGGHRRFDASAVERLGLVRRLRGLGLGLPSITRVLTGQRSLAEAVAAERATLDVELAALAWRRASLRAVEEAAPADRAARLDLLAAVQDGAAARDTLATFWRRFYLGPVPADTVDMFLSVSVPQPPSDPTPSQVVAYAGLVTLVGDPALRGKLRTRARLFADLISDETALHSAVGEACELARLLVLAGRRPGPGPALDRFVAAYASARRTRDTPLFRRELVTHTAADRDPRLRRYWSLVGEVTGEPVTVGTSHHWLLDALERSAR
ncbi:MerR family transcriptional regulator [Amycolatopsis sp. NPDC059027]|uniref:MerR family transcriptional regulator n=1 Tax=unclassified Amycolatopsis TaxID=2618356 RepID=UPI00366F6340